VADPFRDRVNQKQSLQAAEKGAFVIPNPCRFAGEGSVVRKKAKEKADSSPRSKTERGSE
jgi:hypothetical protein